MADSALDRAKEEAKKLFPNAQVGIGDGSIQVRFTSEQDMKEAHMCSRIHDFPVVKKLVGQATKQKVA